MSFIPVSLILPLEQVSCHCQGQTHFIVQSQDTFIQSPVRPTSTPTTAAVPFALLSFSLSYIHSSFAALALPTDLVSSLHCVQANTKNIPMLPGFIGNVSFAFLFLSRFLSLWAHGTQTYFLLDISREQIPLKRCLIVIFYVQFISVHIRKHDFTNISGISLLDDIINNLWALLCLTFGEIFPDYKIYNELPGMFRMNQTLKRWRGIKSSCLKEW